MRHKKIVLAGIISAYSFCANAQEELFDFSQLDSIDNVVYLLDPIDETAEVLTIFADRVDLVIPNEVVSSVFSEEIWGSKSFKVTALGDSIFNNGLDDYYLYSVSFPETITKVSSKAFAPDPPSAIIWNSETPLPSGVLSEWRYRISNGLLYVKKAGLAPSEVKNVVVDSIAENITLKDGLVFNCPVEFTANTISYTHNYKMETGIGECAGWETIALPFTVQTITHSTKGELIPFSAYSSNNSEKRFSLYSLSSSGFRKASGIEANTPYLISMPNNSNYSSIYNVAGKVTFSAANAKVNRTSDRNSVLCDGARFCPAFSYYSTNSKYYAINAINENVSYSGTEKPGSVFVSNYRYIYPFEGYFYKSSAAARTLSIVFADDDETTGMGSIPCDIDQLKPGYIRIYNLSGQFVREVKATSVEEASQYLNDGIYVINGKKVFVKRP